MGRYLIVESNPTLPDSGVTPGAYTNTDITVNSQGIVTSAVDGVSATAFNDLTDVVLTGPVTDQFIQYDGADWINITVAIDTISDVVITTPVSGEFLTYDGADWINTAISVVVTGDIGTIVQAWDAELDAIAALVATGYVAHTGAGTVAERTFFGTDGVVVTNGTGATGNTTMSVSINTLPFTGPIDPVNDLIIFYNTTGTQNEQISVTDAVLSATPILSATSLGTGANVFKGLTSQVLEFREISSTGVGITVAEVVDDIQITLGATLQTISALTPTDNNFIVGNGTIWTLENPATVRTSLGLGTMALETAVDYLLLTGGTMIGAIDMGSLGINALLDPVLAQDAATRNYVDVNLAVAGDGLIKIGNEIDVVGGDGITANANDIILDLTFLDARTDGRYYLKTELNDTTDSTEGASLIGTELKTGLNSATTIEVALDHINVELPFALVSFRQDIDIWNFNITDPDPTLVVINGVEVPRFADIVDTSIHKTLMLPADYDDTRDLVVQVSMAKETTAVGNAIIALAWQQQRTPGFSINDEKTFAPGATTVPSASGLVWTIAGGTFQALDVITLRLSRIGNGGGDTYGAGIDLFAASIVQQ